MGKIVSVVNQKGGVAKTTTAVSLAAGLAAEGKKTLLIDIDPQGNATSGLGLSLPAGSPSVYEVLISDLQASQVVLASNYENLAMLPSSLQLAGAEIELVGAKEREYKLKRALQGLADLYNYIIIDCPPSLGLLTLNALAAADSILIPLHCEYYALEGVGHLMNTYNLVKRHLNPDLAIEGVLLTMFDARTNLSIQVVDSVKEFFGRQVFDAIIPRNVRLSEAPSHGLPIYYYDPKSKGSESYCRFVLEFLSRNQDPGLSASAPLEEEKPAASNPVGEMKPVDLGKSGSSSFLSRSRKRKKNK
jgi:chromosome partitioning protein